MQLKVKLLAFGEHQPATLIVVDGVPSLVVYRHVYQPGELPARSKIIAPAGDEIPPDDRIPGARLIEAARREGFDVVVDVAPESERILDPAFVTATPAPSRPPDAQAGDGVVPQDT